MSTKKEPFKAQDQAEVDSRRGGGLTELGNPIANPSPIRAIVRSLNVEHRLAILKHLVSLDERDRYLRFGYIANEEQIARYVESIDFERDNPFGIYNRRLDLIAFAHLSYSLDQSLDSCAEFGVSVLSHARGRGYGKLLFKRAMKHAINEGVQLIFIHALTENTAMIKIARDAGATVEKDGPETHAYLRLPQADFDSQATELLEEQLAQLNYRLKLQARKFWGLLASIQEIRQGVRTGRHSSSE